MVPQVSIIGILMIVNGSLATLLSLFYLVIGPFILADANFNRGFNFGKDDKMVAGVLVVLGILVLAAGVMNIIGGMQALKYRGRSFVITALFFNVLPFCTLYCLPSSLGLLIWGLIVMFNAEVSQAFALGQEGLSATEIKQRFEGRRPRRRDGGYDDGYDDDKRSDDERRDDDRRDDDRGKRPRGDRDDTGYYEER